MHELFDMLDALASAQDFDGVERAALEALGEAVAEDALDLWRYVSWARFETGQLLSALDAARHADDLLYEAKAHFHLWRFADAQAALDRFEGEGEDAADAEWYRGLLAEFAGADPTRHYRNAARLAPEIHALPVRLGGAEVDAVIRQALEALPLKVAAAIENTVIEVVALPRPHPEVDPISLGLYTGRDMMLRSLEDAPSLPAHIEIYKSNIERIARDREEVVEELRITLLHEVGHHLGFDETGVEHLGLG